MGSIKTISIIVAANIKGLEVGLGKANKSLAKFASGAARMGSLLSFGVTAPLTALGKSAFDTFSKFENGMMKVNTVTGATVDEFKMLTDEAKRLGRTTQFTAQQVADLQLVLGRKGFDPTAIKNMEKSILDLALATGEDLSLAANVVASSINAFGMEAKDASKIANTLASAAANSSIQLSTFNTAFGHAGTAAKSVGVDIEQLSAMMGVLMDNGIKASKAGTGLRKIFIDLAEKGVSFSDSLDKIAKGELDIIDASDLAGKTAAAQLKILADNKKKIDDLANSYKMNTTTLKEMVELMGGTTQAKVLVMQSAIEGLKLEFGAILSDALLPLIEHITAFAGRLAELDEKTKSNILKWVGFAAVLGPVLMSVAALTSMLTPVIGLFKLFNKLIPFSIAGTSRFGIALGKLTVAGWSANGVLGALTGVFRALKLAILTNPIGALILALTSAIGLWVNFKDKNKEANDELDRTSVSAKSASERIAEINKHLDNRDKSGDDLLKEEIKGFQDLTIEALKLKKATYELGKDKFGFDLDLIAIGDLILEIEELEKKLSTYQDTLNKIDKPTNRELNPVISLQKITPTSISEGTTSTTPTRDTGEALEGYEEVREVYSLLERLAPGLDLTALQVKNLNETVVGLFQNFSQGFVDLFDKQTKFVEINGKMEEVVIGFGEKFGSFMKEFLIGIAKMIAQTTILAALLALTGLGGLGAGASAKNFGDIFKNLLGGAFASGGNPPVGKVSLVGEQGPELFVPNSSGTIIPNHALSGGSTSTVIPDVRITGDDLLIVFDRANRRKNRR